MGKREVITQRRKRLNDMTEKNDITEREKIHKKK